MDNDKRKTMFREAIEKAVEETMKDALKMMTNAPDAEPDPDPETVEMLEALDKQGERTPDGLLLDVLEDVRDLIDLTVNETEEWGASTAQMVEIDKSVAELADTALRLYDRLTVGKTLEKLRFMRGVEQANDENIRKWSDEHEQGGRGPRGNQGEG